MSSRFAILYRTDLRRPERRADGVCGGTSDRCMGRERESTGAGDRLRAATGCCCCCCCCFGVVGGGGVEIAWSDEASITDALALWAAA